MGILYFFLPTWAYATRINKSLAWWDNTLPVRMRKKFSKLWIYGLVATSISWLFVMEMGIWGYFPGQTNPDTILNVVFIFLFLTVIFANLTFICAFARDIEEHK